MFNEVISDGAAGFAILATVATGILAILSLRFASKAELEEVKRELYAQDKAISNMDIKLDHVMKGMEDLNNTTKDIRNDIKDFLINNPLENHRKGKK